MPTEAIHIVSTTYGTWLPGDDRGHWSALYDLYGHLKSIGHQLNIPDEQTHRFAKARMTEPPKILTALEIVELEHLFGDLATRYSPAFTRVTHSPTLSAAITGKLGKEVRDSFEQPRVLAAAIEPTHFHLLVSSLKEDVAKYVGRLKRSTSAVLLKRPENAGRKGIWTTGYWKAFLFDVPGVVAVKDYIERHNERAGRPRRPYDWVTPM